MNLIRSMLLMLLSLTVFGKTSDNSTVAYLYNIKGSIKIVRNNQPVKASAICSELQVGDKIIPKDQASAIIAYPNKSFTIRSSYTVIRPKAEKSTVQSKSLINPALLRLNMASVIREKDPIHLLAPAVKSFSLTPDILLKNDSAQRVTLSLYQCVGDRRQLLGAVKTRQKTLCWTRSGFPQLEQNKTYQLKLIYEAPAGQRFSNTHTFSTFSKAETACLQSNWETDTGRCRLLKAFTLLQQDCPGDAYAAVAELLKLEPENPLLLKLSKRCLSIMGRSSD